MGFHDHRGHVAEEAQMKMYTFDNVSMENNLVDEKTGKIIIYKEINCCELSEESARKKSARGKLDPTGKLSDDYKLTKIIELNKDWK